MTGQERPSSEPRRTCIAEPQHGAAWIVVLQDALTALGDGLLPLAVSSDQYAYMTESRSRFTRPSERSFP